MKIDTSKLFRICLISAALLTIRPADGQPQERQGVAKQEVRQNVPEHKRSALRETRDEFFATDEARRVGDQVLLYQRVTGGWPKNIDMARQLTDDERAAVEADKQRRDDSTTDNDATNMQLTYLARLYRATGDVKYRDAFRQGIDYLLSGQYDNGGWPQFWPEMRDYQIHITYNDNAMVNTMNMIRAVAQGDEPYTAEDLIDKSMRTKMMVAFDKGVECILNTQIVYKGELTVWCQQHDRETLAPAPARAYELPSFCTQESREIVRLLMSLPNPDERIRRAVHGAMSWFDKYKLTGYRVERTGWRNDPKRNVRLVADPSAGPIWARFYDLERCEPYVCDRDGIPRRHLEEIGVERRTGYSWYNDGQTDLYPLYEEWGSRYDPNHKVTLDLNGQGANENGTVEWFRRPHPDQSAFDVIVEPGTSIQRAIEQAPENGIEPFKILLLKGVYNQKVIIDRPNIVLVGEDRDSTLIVYAEGRNTPQLPDYRGQKVEHGVISITQEADNCVISGLTVYNNYGTTVEETTSHQFAIFGRASHTIVLNSNVWSDGNDALALWAKGGSGMYYHADLSLRCPGVDFLCPRGWCYATRCNFLGDSRAIIWHDGRGDISQKLVITESTFDAKSPTILGRWHHDSQFFIVNCTMSANILDTNISYAYSDKVLDPCPWGQRVYYYGCNREGGHSGWLRDNINESSQSPEFYEITARWTFDNRWDPEARISALWSAIQYSAY